VPYQGIDPAVGIAIYRSGRIGLGDGLFQLDVTSARTVGFRAQKVYVLLIKKAPDTLIF
jgi:hypothetical protein